MKSVVINNRESLVQGQLQPTGKNKDGTLIIGRVVTFLPGLNLVDAEDLKALRKNPTFEMNFSVKIPPSPAPEQNPEKVGKTTLEMFMFTVKNPKDGATRQPVAVEDVLPLSKLSEEVCADMIAEVHVVDVLRRWSIEDSRPGVRHEIEKRIVAITTGDPAGPASMGR